ncbi:metalloprotease [Candidatus Woesearchaeota archaeon]|nr:metalloprotease [Candidatus Woesearchaeota archaeon]
MYRTYRSKTFPWLTTSEFEIKDLLKSWIFISLAFTMASAGISFTKSFAVVFLMSAFTVGLGFLLHEMGHKILAQKYGCLAEFRSDDRMLFMAVIISLFGFVFVAPGAVLIHGHLTKKRYGIISMMGPSINFLLAIIFLIFKLLNVNSAITTISGYGFMINAWIGLFNMIPFGNFDGIKILSWNKLVYGGMVAAGVALMGVNYLT